MKELFKSFEDSIFSNETTEDLIVDYSEIGIDKLLDSELLKEMPIIKTIVGMYKVGLGIKERFTLKKVATFLFRLQSISEKEKNDFLNKISKEEGYKSDIVEKLLVLLDRLDDADKAEIIGNLFKATILDKIAIDDFYKLSFIVDRIYIKDLKTFCFYNAKDISNEIKRKAVLLYSKNLEKDLSSFGILKESIISDDTLLELGSVKLNYHYQYRVTDLGWTLAKYAAPNSKNYF